MGGDRMLAEIPVVDVLILLFEEFLESADIAGAEVCQMRVGERSEQQIGFLDPR